MRAYFERTAVWAVLWWTFFGLEFGDWLGWENAVYAIGMGLALTFLEFRVGPVVLAAMRRRFAKPS